MLAPPVAGSSGIPRRLRASEEHLSLVDGYAPSGRRKHALGFPLVYGDADTRHRRRHAAIREADPVPTNWR